VMTAVPGLPGTHDYAYKPENNNEPICAGAAAGY